MMDLIAHEIYVVTHPEDDTAARALIDHRIEHLGVTPGEAARAVIRIRRIARDAEMIMVAVGLLNEESQDGRRARTKVRRACPVPVSPAVPIDVVPGLRSPRVCGEPGHYTFRHGGRCYSPGAARMAGYQTLYHRSAQRITVGAGWVMTHAR